MSFARKLKREKERARGAERRRAADDFADVRPLGRVEMGEFVGALAFSPSGDALAAVAADGAVACLDAATGAPRFRVPAHRGPARALAFTSAGAIVTGGEDGRVVVLDAASGALLREAAPPPSGRGWVESIAARPGTSIAAAAQGRVVRLIDVETGREAGVLGPLASTATAPVFSPTGDRCYVGAYGGITGFDPARPEATPLSLPYKGGVITLAVSPDGAFVAAGYLDRTVKCWRVDRSPPGEWVMTGYPDKPRALAFDGANRYLYTAASRDVVVWTLDALDDDPGLVLEMHAGRVSALAARPGGDVVASADDEGRVCFWRAPSKKPLLSLSGALGGVTAIAWSPDGGAFAMGSGEGEVELFRVERS